MTLRAHSFLRPSCHTPFGRIAAAFEQADIERLKAVNRCQAATSAARTSRASTSPTPSCARRTLWRKPCGGAARPGKPVRGKPVRRRSNGRQTQHGEPDGREPVRRPTARGKALPSPARRGEPVRRRSFRCFMGGWEKVRARL